MSIYYSFFIHSSVDALTRCFHVLAIVNSAEQTLGYMYLFKLWFSQSICLGLFFFFFLFLIKLAHKYEDSTFIT